MYILRVGVIRRSVDMVVVLLMSASSAKLDAYAFAGFILACCIIRLGCLVPLLGIEDITSMTSNYDLIWRHRYNDVL